MKKEKIIITLIAILVIILANLPVLYFAVTKTDGFTFLGRRYLNSQDTYTYVSFIEQSKQGRFLFENLYTSEPQTPSLFRPSYLVIGKFAALFNITSILAFQIAKFIFAGLFMFVLYKFISVFFQSSTKRIVAFTVILISSGLGFLFKSFYPNTSDLWIPESLTFLSLGEAPHFILSQLLMLGGFYWIIKYFGKRETKSLIVASSLFLFLSLEHPFNILVVFPAILLALLWTRFSPLKSVLIAALSSFGILYQVFEASRNPILNLWQKQNVLASPTLMSYVVGFGLLLPLAVFGVENFIKENKFKNKLILTWLLSSAVMVYSPFAFQRRMIEGINIPLGILAVSGIFTIYPLFKRYKDLFLVGILIVLSLGSFNSIYVDFKEIPVPEMKRYYYIDQDDLKAISWLETQTTFNDIIFSNIDYGNLIPGLIGRKIYLGHNIQTVSIGDKLNIANSFLVEKDDYKSFTFLKDNKITYIFLGKDDTLLKYGFKPNEKYFLQKVYDQNGTFVYKFEPDNHFFVQK